ncbi:MAG: hypothetical protein WCR02_01015 [Sphaerochaetaceae bacterium]
MNVLATNLEKSHYLNHWLVSEIHHETYTGERVKITTSASVFEGYSSAATHENPLRVEFLKRRRAFHPEKPVLTKPEPLATVFFNKSESMLHSHFPFGDPVLSLSRFWPSPTWISAVAYSLVSSPRVLEIPCTLSVCGGFSLWVNGNLVIEFNPFERNVACKTNFLLPLQAGNNELIVYWDELAERDSECSFSLMTEEPMPFLLQSFPIGERNAMEILAVEHALGSLAFTQDHFEKGEVLLTCDNPYTDKAFVISLEGATEENEMAGILYSTQAVFAPSKHIASLGPCEKLPFGFLQFKTKAEVEGMTICNAITMENFPLSLLPPILPTIEQRKQQAFVFLSQYGEQNGNRAVALLHAKGEMREIESILRRQIAFINRRSDCSDFYLPYFPHILREFSHSGMLSEEMLEAMKNCILNFRYWHDEPGSDGMWFWSENHALMFHVCQLLCGELYPNEIFPNSGMTGTQMQQKAKGLLNGWFDMFFKQGFTEWNSPAYLPIDTLGFANLYAQTCDLQLKQRAREALDFCFHLLSVYSFDGVFCTTAGRTYPKELLANNANCPSFLNYIGYGIGNVSHAGKGVVAFCFSDYEPPKEYRQYYQVPKGKALVCQSTQGYEGYVDLYSYKTHRFSMTSANNFHVGIRGFQENPLHVLFSATAQLWITHPGELAEFGHARPSYWAGNGMLPRVNQYKSFASSLYSIPTSHEVDFTHVYFPTMEFALWKHKGDWLFAQAPNGGYVAIFSSNGLQLRTYGPNRDREFISKGRNCIWLVRAAEPEEFSSFADFERSMENAVMLDMQTLSYTFADPRFGSLHASWDYSLTVNGVAVSYSGFPPKGKVDWVSL